MTTSTTTGSMTATSEITGTWTIDPSHSEVGFTVRHLMSKVRGSFASFTGTITAPSADPVDASVTVTIDTTSVTTNNEARDNHLRSHEILAAEASPTMTFASTRITPRGDGWTISGDLTINGITRPVDLDAELFGVEVDAYGQTRLGAEATTKINRKDFGVSFNVPLEGGKFLIGDDIVVNLAIEAVRA